jgi:6,7-dimethyl-8-ribityllumazine synthase
MATAYQNLSEYDPDVLPERYLLENQRYAIVVADWNPQITHTLLEGAVDCLTGIGVLKSNINVVHVPGTFELTYAASHFVHSNLNAVEEQKFNAVIVLGCVIQGDTPHFTYVCEGVTQGITRLNTIENGCPVIFGVLTTNTLQQALDRAGGMHGNKGVEAAITAVKMANILW